MLLMAVTTAGCAHRHHRDRPIGPFTPNVECNANKAQRYLGNIADDRTARRARHVSRALIVRRYGPDEARTLEHRPGRLVLEVGKDGRISRISCT